MRYRTRAVLLGILLILATQAEAQLGPTNGADLPPADLDRVQVGSLAPDFALNSSDGTRISLSDSLRGDNVVLVFYRGHW